MKCMLVVSCLVALAAANPGYLGVPGIAHTAYAAAPVAYSAIVAPGAVTSQYHTQDTLGQYAYGYQGDTSAKHEVRTADGITQGAYSYLDSNGLVQSARYVSDPLNGFRVAATNDPSLAASAGPAVVAAAPAVAAVAAPAVVAADAVEISAARAAHFNAHVAAKAALLGRKRRSPGYLSAAAPVAVTHAAAPVAVAHAVPAVYAAAPAVYAAAPVSTFGYSSVSAHPATVVGYAAHAAPVAVAHAAPVAVAHAAPVAVADAAHLAAKAALLGRKRRSPGYLSAAAPVAVAHAAAPVAVAHAAPAVVAAPVSTFGYSSVSAHPATVVGYAAHAAPVAVAHAAPLAVAHAAPVAVADAAHIAAKAALLGRKKRSPGFLHSAAVAAPLAYAAPIAATTTYAHPIATTYAHGPILAY